MLFSGIFGVVLSGQNIGRFRWLLWMYAVAHLAAAFWTSRCPSQPLTRSDGMHPLRAFRYVKEDRVFRLTLICWMLMGFANLMMQPLRVEYLANPNYGLKLETATVALIVGVIPNVARLLMSPIWGVVFDRMNFFALRVVLNVGFAVSILAFFTSNNMAGLLCGAVLFGISSAGGDVAWSLWVTKFAPPDRVVHYMAMHTFLTGLRGLVAPFVAFYLLGVLSVATLGWIGAGLIVVSALILAREIKAGQSPDVGTQLVKEAAK
jgi:MFS family permease